MIVALSLAVALNLDSSSIYAQRLAMSHRFQRIEVGLSQREVEFVLGRPSETDTDYCSGEIDVWKYCSGGAGDFPDLGTVYFDKEDKVLTYYGQTPPESELRKIRDYPRVLLAINKTSGYNGFFFDTPAFVKAIDLLQDRPRAQTVAILREYLTVRPISTYTLNNGASINMTGFSEYLERVTALASILLGEFLPADFKPIQGNFAVVPHRPRLRTNPLLIFEGVPVALPTIMIPQGRSSRKTKLGQSEIKLVKLLATTEWKPVSLRAQPRDDAFYTRLAVHMFDELGFGIGEAFDHAEFMRRQIER